MAATCTPSSCAGGVWPHTWSTGVLAGGIFAVVAGRWLQALLAGVSPTDFASFGGAVGLAFAMTAVGSLLPALKATRVDPLQVMRAD